MDPVSVGALVGAGANLLGQGFNFASTQNMNKKTRQWNEHMYDQQKRDNLEFWNMQNSYNSPEQQMQRMAKAGMNPALAYGNGSVNNTSSSAPDAPHAMPYRPDAPRLELPQIADTYQNIQHRAVQLSNEKQIGNNLALQGKATELANIRTALENKFATDTILSRTRGFLGDNEQKYQNGIRNLINVDLLKTLSGIYPTIGNGSVSTVSDDPKNNLLLESARADLKGKHLSNSLRGTAIIGNQQENRIRKTKADYSDRMFSGKISDMGSKDWLNMAIGLFK